MALSFQFGQFVGAHHTNEITGERRLGQHRGERTGAACVQLQGRRDIGGGRQRTQIVQAADRDHALDACSHIGRQAGVFSHRVGNEMPAGRVPGQHKIPGYPVGQITDGCDHRVAQRLERDFRAQRIFDERHAQAAGQSAGGQMMIVARVQ